jgi:hypothetical protein
MSTGFILVSTLAILAVIWAGVEVKTLRDKIPGNHITAVVRRAMKAEPGPFILFFFALGFLCGHLFWP